MTTILIFSLFLITLLEVRAQRLPTDQLWQLFETIDHEVPVEQECPVIGSIPDFVGGIAAALGEILINAQILTNT